MHLFVIKQEDDFYNETKFFIKFNFGYLYFTAGTILNDTILHQNNRRY
jgi:hypothetical protein